MIKTLAFIERRPDLSREAFREHYESVHAPLALPLLEGLRRYVRYHVEEVLHGDVHFDVLTAFWYRDESATNRIFEKLAGEEGAAIVEDEGRFMNREANRFFAVSERSWPPRARGEREPTRGAEKAEKAESVEGGSDFFVLVARPGSMSRFDCATLLAKDHWSDLVGTFSGSTSALLRDLFPMSGESLEWDAVMQVRADGPGDLERGCRDLESAGFRVAAVRTRRFETELDRSN